MEQMVMTAILTLASAYGGVKAAMNGINIRLARTEGKVDDLDTKMSKHGERLARIETRLDPS